MLNNLPASFGGPAPRPNTPTAGRKETSTLFGNRASSSSDAPGAIRFSFDWARGKQDKKAESLSNLTQWGAYGEGLPHLRTSRWKHFVALLVLSGVMFALAGLFLPLVLLRPQKFSLFFTLGSLLAMVAFAVLRGPLEQLKHMCSLRRLPFTSTYVGSMVLTLYAALVAQSYLLVLLFASIQCAALAWYVLSYVPGGAPALKLVTKLVSRGVRSCCGAAGASGTQQWTQLLPL